MLDLYKAESDKPAPLFFIHGGGRISDQAHHSIPNSRGASKKLARALL